MKTWLQLEGKTVIVTGAASGIGRAVAIAFAEVGARVIVIDNNTEGSRQAVKELATFSEKKHYYLALDISNSKDVEEKFLSLPEDIDILVNGAAINIPGSLVEIDINRATKIFSINQTGMMICTQIIAKRMIAAHGGVVVNITSESGLEGSSGQSAYAASKAAVYSLTRSWAKELGPHGIRVVGIAPGILEPTGMTNDNYLSALAKTRKSKVNSISRNYISQIPLGRVGTLLEVANTILFLACPKASYITGTVLNLSGGKSRG